MNTMVECVFSSKRYFINIRRVNVEIRGNNFEWSQNMEVKINKKKKIGRPNSNGLQSNFVC